LTPPAAFEDYDYGGINTSYSDATAAGNFGGFYRSGKMDIGYNYASARYFTGWTSPTEWGNSA